MKRKLFVKVICRRGNDPANAITFDPCTLKDRIVELKKTSETTAEMNGLNINGNVWRSQKREWKGSGRL